MELLIQLIEAIAWPTAVIWLGYLFRAEVKSLSLRLHSLKYGDAEAHFKEQLDQVEAQTHSIEVTGPAAAKDEVGQAVRLDGLIQLAELSPRAAIAAAWLEIEVALKKLSQRAKCAPLSPTSAGSLAREMEQTGLISKPIMIGIVSMESMRNKIVHRYQPALDVARQHDAIHYAELALNVVNYLNSRSTELNPDAPLAK